MMRFAHVAVNVTNLARAVAFYQQILSWEIVSSGTLSGPAVERMMGLPTGTEGRNTFLGGEGARTKIELIEWRGPINGGHAVQPGARGILALSFITTPSEIADLSGRITAAGGRCPTEPETTIVGERQITVLLAEDPDGNRLEFIAP